MDCLETKVKQGLFERTTTKSKHVEFRLIATA